LEAILAIFSERGLKLLNNQADFDSAPASQSVFGPASLSLQEEAANSGLSRFGSCLRAPIWRFRSGRLPKVSGPIREYYRFRETMAGDLVRSRLPTERSIAERRNGNLHIGSSNPRRSAS
jgi:hypothetical protein